MPFDALAMRAIEMRWRQRLIGAVCVRVQQAADRVLLTVKRSDRSSENILLVLQPGMQRIHRTEHNALTDKRPPFPWLQHLVPFTIRAVDVPPFERVMTIAIERHDDWGQPVMSELVVELAGHLTNLILVDSQGRVEEAWRKIPPGRPGRTVWPKMPYQPPPPLKNPLETQNAADFPPWAQRWLEAGGSLAELERHWNQGFPDPTWILFNTHAEDVWVYPMPGYQAKPAEDLEKALDDLFRQREKKRQEEALKSQLLAQVRSRREHLTERLAQYHIDRQESGEAHKQMGDLWLTYQYAFKADPGLSELTVTGYDGEPVVLQLDDGESPSDKAAEAYRRYKKIKARHEALDRLIPALQAELRQLAALAEESETSRPLDWYRAQLKTQGATRRDGAEREAFRHFRSAHGLDIWVGRNRDENAQLTFQKARPDDLWFHTKQAPGSHVLLGCGKTNPDLEDLLDAAELAVFFSSAQASSTVPVDYTRRKFVRKRPHAEPGQVLYQREKTLYITPDAERLRRLGAISEKLVD